MRTLRRCRFVVAALVALSACGGGDGDTAASDADTADDDAAVVTIETFSFQPDPLTVEAGTAITFTNEDKIDHTVTAGTREAPTPEVFDETLPEQGATASITLDEPGTYDYFCKNHPGVGMTAQIIVQ